VVILHVICRGLYCTLADHKYPHAGSCRVPAHISFLLWDLESGLRCAQQAAHQGKKRAIAFLRISMGSHPTTLVRRREMHRTPADGAGGATAQPMAPTPESQLPISKKCSRAIGNILPVKSKRGSFVVLEIPCKGGGEAAVFLRLCCQRDVTASTRPVHR
jgi:hypothetical protein